MRVLFVGVLASSLLTGCLTTRIRPPKVEAPENTVPVEVVSGNTGRAWDVFVGGERVCSSPCNGFVEQGHSILLRSAGDTILIPHVDEYKPYGPIRVRAVGSNDGAMAGGITFTTLGGMAVITGGTLALVSLRENENSAGMRTAGVITLGAGVAVTAAGLLLMLNAFPHVEYYAFNGDQPVRLVFGPGMVSAEY